MIKLLYLLNILNKLYLENNWIAQMHINWSISNGAGVINILSCNAT